MPQLTPIDTEMPFLDSALNVTLAAEKLQRLPGVPLQMGLQLAQMVRHKPGRRCLIEYTFTDAESGAEPWVILGKARSRGVDHRSIQCQQALWNAGFDETSSDRISVPEPLGMIPEWAMWFQRKIPGVSAFQVLATEAGPTMARRMGAALAKLHRTQLPCQRQHTLADELRLLHERLPHLLERYPQWQGRLDRLLAQCDRLGASMPSPSQTVGIHRDFYPDQVWVSPEGRLYLLDFDLYCLGDPAVDIGNFVAHLMEYSLRTTGDPDRWQPQATAFREEAMGQNSVEVSSFGVDSYIWLTLVRHIYISSLFRDRAPFTESLLQLCEERYPNPP